MQVLNGTDFHVVTKAHFHLKTKKQRQAYQGESHRVDMGPRGALHLWFGLKSSSFSICLHTSPGHIPHTAFLGALIRKASGPGEFPN